MSKIQLLGNRVALTKPTKPKSEVTAGKLITEGLETEQNVGIVRYVGDWCKSYENIPWLHEGAKVYYLIDKVQNIRIKGENLILLNEEDVIAYCEE